MNFNSVNYQPSTYSQIWKLHGVSCEPIYLIVHEYMHII